MNDSDRLLIFTGPSPRGWHRLQLFLECPQRYAWNYIAGLKGINEDAPPLVKGSLVHLGLAQHYAQIREKQNGRDPKLYFDPIEAIDVMIEAKPHWKEHGELAKRVIDAYLLKWRNERFKVVAVEELLEAEIEGYRFTGRMDLVVEDSAGKVWIIDHKTTGTAPSPTTQVLLRLRANPRLSNLGQDSLWGTVWRNAPQHDPARRRFQV